VLGGAELSDGMVAIELGVWPLLAALAELGVVPRPDAKPSRTTVAPTRIEAMSCSRR